MEIEIGTAEVEIVLVSYEKVGEAAEVGMLDKVKEQGTCARVTPKAGVEIAAELKNELVAHVGDRPVARLDKIQFSDALPKTRSGKIMRRLMKSLLTGKELGDLSTIEEEASVDDEIRKAV